MISLPLYLDPGTGSLLLYALVGIGATLIFGLRGLWYKVRTLFRKNSGLKHTLPDIVFHSEGGKYWQVFQPVIVALDKLQIPCAYITPDPKDPALSYGSEFLLALNPGNEMTTIAYMNHIKTKIVVSTTPHLDIYMLKKSRHVEKYIHLFHAPSDVSFYEKYAFDYYDGMFSVGPFQEKNIRFLEEKRGTLVKDIYPVGCTYLDYLIEEKSHLDISEKTNSKVVLYAPTWGARSSLVKYGAKLIEKLMDKGFYVILRPHPQSWVSHKELMDEVVDSLNQYEKRSQNDEAHWRLDNKRTGLESMEESDLMLTDISGVLLDYVFLFSKPILLMNADVSLGGFEAEDLESEWNVKTSRNLSRVISDEEIDSLGDIAIEALNNEYSYSQKMKACREEEIYNFGHAGESAAKKIIQILKDFNL